LGAGRGNKGLMDSSSEIFIARFAKLSKKKKNGRKGPRTRAGEKFTGGEKISHPHHAWAPARKFKAGRERMGGKKRGKKKVAKTKTSIRGVARMVCASEDANHLSARKSREGRKKEKRPLQMPIGTGLNKGKAKTNYEPETKAVDLEKVRLPEGGL